MSITNTIFIHDTKTIKIVNGSKHNSWDVTITDKNGDCVTLFCFGEGAVVMLTDKEENN